MQYILAISCVFVWGYTFGQPVSAGRVRELTKEEEYLDSANRHCLSHSKYNELQRMSNYPFSSAASVRIVSFKKKHAIGSELPKKGKAVDLSGLFESVLLKKVDVDTLTSILYNIGYKGQFYSIYKGCYEPRNAILFLDKNGKVFSYIELCFACYDFRVSSSRVVSGEFCIEKFEILSAFFANRRVEYGTLYKD